MKFIAETEQQPQAAPAAAAAGKAGAYGAAAATWAFVKASAGNNPGDDTAVGRIIL